MKLSEISANYVNELPEAGLALLDDTYAPKSFVVLILRLIEESISGLQRGELYYLDEILGGDGCFDGMCATRCAAVLNTVDTLVVDGVVPLAFTGNEGEYYLLPEREVINRAA